MRDDIERYWREMGRITRAMPLREVAQAADLLLDCHHRHGTILVCGNGGSAATASHLACDLAKGTRTPLLPAFRVIPLTDNAPLLTAWANDAGYECVFAEQVTTLARPGDTVVIISASGNSPNVLAAAAAARAGGVTVIALTGQHGGALAPLADLAIRVPSTSIEQVEDAHLIVAHSICVALRGRLRAEAELLATVETALLAEDEATPALAD